MSHGGIQLEGLDILLTYNCTGRCAHCCYRAGPGQNYTMSLVEVAGYMEEVAEHPLHGILLFGGEPFLYPELLRESVIRAAPLCQQLYIFTNGYWATSPEVARRRLAELQEAGQDYILFSADAFHQEHVPLERIAIGIEAARDLGYSSINIDGYYLDEATADNAFNRRSREIMAALAERCDLSDVTVTFDPLRMVGRAADELSAYLPATAMPPANQCPLPGYLGGDLLAPNGIEIHPEGWVNFCAGLALGNARQRPLGEILAGYDPEAHPIIWILANEGPAGLLDLAKGHGYQGPEAFVDRCHMCYEARRFLHPHYPEHLAPAHVYTAA